MSMYNRYSFAKDIYRDCLVIIRRKNKYYSFDKDKLILDYIGFSDKLYLVRKYSISYIILDNLDIIDMVIYDSNNYYKYLYLSYIKIILYEVKGSIINE